MKSLSMFPSQIIRYMLYPCLTLTFYILSLCTQDDNLPAMMRQTHRVHFVNFICVNCRSSRTMGDVQPENTQKKTYKLLEPFAWGPDSHRTARLSKSLESVLPRKEKC